MTVDSRKCFATVEALKRFEPDTLCRFLNQYPEYVARRLGALPADPDEKSMPYERIIPLFLDEGEDTPGDFLEKMILIIDMAKPNGNDKLREEATRTGVAYETFRGKTLHDTAMKAAMLSGDLLERAHARMVLFRKRGFAYYPPFADEVPEYRQPSDAMLDELGRNLTLWFHGSKTKIKAKVLLFDFPNEAWFLVRRGGQPIRMSVFDEETGDTVSRFLRPEEYDGIVYNKAHGELRIMSELVAPVQEGYMSRFGELLADDNQFFGQRTVFFPERVMDMRCSDLLWAGNTKIGEIRLAKVGYQLPGGDIDVLASPKCLLRRNEGGRLIPGRVEKVLYAEFKFTFLSDKRERSVRVEAGREATYQRDSDVSLIEEWLRAKDLMRGVQTEKCSDEKAA